MELRYERMNDVFEKWHVLGLPFEATFHRFTGQEHGPAHDHPWQFRSTVLAGGYVERVYQMDGTFEDVERSVGETFVNEASHIHQIVAFPHGETWTLIVPGPGERKPGFYEFREDGAYYRPWDRELFECLAA